MKRSTLYKVVIFFFGVSCYFGQVLVLKENLFELVINDFGTELWPMTDNSRYNEIDQMIEPYEITKFENNIVKRISRDVQNNNSRSSNNETTDYSKTSSTLKSTIETTDKVQPSTENSNTSYTESSTSTISTTNLRPLHPIVINRTEQNYTNAVDTFPSTFSDQNYGNFVMVFFLSAAIILTLGVFFVIIYNKQQGRSFYQVREICLNHEESAA